MIRFLRKIFHKFFPPKSFTNKEEVINNCEHIWKETKWKDEFGFPVGVDYFSEKRISGYLLIWSKKAFVCEKCNEYKIEQYYEYVRGIKNENYVSYTRRG